MADTEHPHRPRSQHDPTGRPATAAGGGRPIVFGEVLFDCFEGDGTTVLGGAPFNVAWHLHGFGLHPLFISRIGRDDRGEEVLAAMDAWGMDTTGVQQDDRHPTGMVRVDLGGDQPRFDILADQAYDHIDAATARQVAAGGTGALLYHGSLAARAAGSRQAMEALRGLGIPTFVDINLRPPWWQHAAVADMVANGRWVKLNEDELAEVIGRHLQPAELETAAVDLRRERALEALVVTLGGRGALAVTAGGVHYGAPSAALEVVDTVGAGDAFSAVTILGLLHGWPLPQTLERAVAFAGAICGIRGATTRDTGLYAGYRERWGV